MAAIRKGLELRPLNSLQALRWTLPWIFIHSLKDCFQSTYHGPDTPLNIGEATKSNKGHDPVLTGYILVGQTENQYINGEKQEITNAR